ncbi:integrase catalytic domain-containing protein [Trichonephila clavipes]|nr:integrase catalytic domain-containing protein [Trichonephila clavipes]
MSRSLNHPSPQTHKSKDNSRQLIRNHIKRYNAGPVKSESVSLPADRVRDADMFELIGIDLAGPLFLKKGEQVCVVLYTGAVRELKNLDWIKIERETEIERIKWKFNPPTAAWWERLIRVLKDLLKRTLGNAVLTYEELLTVLCDCESIVNSRPLTYVSEDPDDLIPLTPAMFMMSNSSLNVTDLNLSDFARFRKMIKFRSAEMGEFNDVPLKAEALKIPSASVDVSESAMIPVNVPNNMHKVSRYGRTIRRPRRLNAFNVTIVFESE